MFQHRAGIDARFTVFVDVGVVNQIIRHQIDRAFDALEGAADGPGKGTQHGRFADANITFEQHVAAREYRDVDVVNHVILADHRFFDFRFQRERTGAPILQERVISIHYFAFLFSRCTIGRSDAIARIIVIILSTL